MSQTTTISNVALTSLRIKEYPRFVKNVEEKMFNQISKEIKEKITVVVGLTNVGIDMSIALGIAWRLNDERRLGHETEDFLHCRAIYYKIISSMWVKYLQIERGIKPPTKEDFILFIHCCFDKPIWKRDKYPELRKIDDKEFLLSEYLQSKNAREQMFKTSQLKIDHLIILPAPREEYIEFMLSK